MAVFRFRIYWEEDDLTYRDIEVLSKQTFQDFQQVIVKSFDFDGKHPSLFYVSNDRWERSIMLDSEVLTNKKDAPALSMIKTPVAALVADPAQKFIFVYDKDKKWTFLVELLHISKEETFKRTYPYLLRKEGISPPQYSGKGSVAEKMIEEEEQYDLASVDLEDGFGNEGEQTAEADSEGGSQFEF